MSSFQDIETQNARRPHPGGARLHGRGRWRFSGLRDELLNGRAAEVEFCADMTEWMVMTEMDRWNELFRLAHEKRGASLRDGPAPLRLPRTALGLCHAGPIAPPSSAISVRIRLPDGTERDLHAEEVTAGTWTARHPETGEAYVFSSAATPPRG